MATQIFREAASLDVDNDDVKRFSDFTHRKTADSTEHGERAFRLFDLLL